MDLKVISVLSIILVAGLSILAEGKTLPTRCQCKVAPRERKDCGHPGMSAVECRKAGCCFDASVSGLPRCFAPKAKKVRKVCPNNPDSRRNCGFPGITAKECERKGCCFRAYPAGVPWCFYHRVVEQGETREEKYWLFNLAEETSHDDRNAQKAAEERSTSVAAEQGATVFCNMGNGQVRLAE
nr:PREDICTED: trefoil factor 2-like [Phalacrocorax carbo]